MGDISKYARPHHYERVIQLKRARRRNAVPRWALLALGLLVGAGISPVLSGNRSLPDVQRLVAAVNPNQAVTFEICAFGDQPNCVVDGYTIHRNGVKIRLEDIDAPEIGLYQCWSELNLGLKAQMRLLELINAGPFEVVRVGKRDVDQYGRQLRTLYRNAQSLGLMLVSEGLAHRWEGHKHNWCG